MRAIKPITEAEIASLRAEPQDLFDPHCVYSGPDIKLPARIVARLSGVARFSCNCWRVSGWNSGNGFANISVNGKNRKVHRVIYTLLVGPIPFGAVLDHKKHVGCEYRDCANPDHLEPVSVKVNTERGAAVLYASTPPASDNV